VRSAANARLEVERPLRADAQRNRHRVVLAARAAFAAADDTVPLEDIARDAGVGIATLYRNFPTRESLVEAVYADELDEVTSNTAKLLARLSADAALLAWMTRYADFIRTKRGMLRTLRIGLASGRVATPRTRERVTAAISTILAAGIDEGVFRADVTSDDVTALLLGVFRSTDTDEITDQTGRLIALIVDALRPQPSTDRPV
jgi:AcrR family transcriptional regulator